MSIIFIIIIIIIIIIITLSVQFACSLMLEVTLKLVGLHPIQGGSYNPSCLMLRVPGNVPAVWTSMFRVRLYLFFYFTAS